MLTAIEDRIIVEPEDPPTQTETGIHLPQNIHRDSRGARWGVVVEAGPGKVLDSGVRIDHGIRTRDRVLFREMAGAEVKFDGQRLFILRAEEVLAKEER